MKPSSAPFILAFMTLALLMFPLVQASAPQARAAQPVQEEAPRDLPAILQKAIDGRDAEAAAARLDFDRIMGDFFKAALPKINAAAESGEISLPQPLPMLLGGLNSGSAQSFLSSEIRKFTLYGVASGCFAGRPLPPEEIAALDGGLFLSFGKLSVARKEFTPGRLLSRQGNNALIQSSLFDHGSRRVYDLKMALELRAGRWVVVGIANAEALAGLLLEEARERRR